MRTLLATVFTILSFVSQAQQWCGVNCTDGPWPGTPGCLTAVECVVTVPTVTPAPSFGEINVWCGLDGYGSSTVQQIGFSCTSSENVVTYRLWTCMFPAVEVYHSEFILAPGNEIRLSVSTFNADSDTGVPLPINGNSVFRMRADNLTTGQRFQQTFTSRTPKCSSAGVNVENFHGVPKFTDVVFRECYAYVHLDEQWKLLPIGLLPRADQFSQNRNLSFTPVTWDGLGFQVTYQP